jgi:hypothetical protein
MLDFHIDPVPTLSHMAVCSLTRTMLHSHHFRHIKGLAVHLIG